MATAKAATKEASKDAPKRRTRAVSKADAIAQEQEGDLNALSALEPGAGDVESWLDKPVDDLSDVKRWIIGKPPTEAGVETEYSIYVQQPLGWMARTRFFSLILAALSKAIRASGGDVAGMGDIFGDGGGTLRERGEKLMQRDWQDATTFMALLAELSAYVPDLMMEMYCIFLQVPTKERFWAKIVFEQAHDPERNLWGPTDDEHREIIGRFIDQNYEELRGFFTNDLPMFARRVVTKERERSDRESASALSKQSNTSGQPEAATA